MGKIQNQPLIIWPRPHLFCAENNDPLQLGKLLYVPLQVSVWGLLDQHKKSRFRSTRTSHCACMVKVSTWYSLNWTSHCARVTFKLLSFYSATKVFENPPLLKFITCCVEAIDTINVRLWQPGEQTEITHKKQTDRQTDWLSTITRGRGRASG